MIRHMCWLLLTLKQDGQSVYHIVAATHIVDIAEILMNVDCPLDAVDKNVIKWLQF